MTITLTIPSSFLRHWRWAALALLAAFAALPGPAIAAGGNSITAPDTVGDVGSSTAMVLDAGGNPVMSYFDGTNGDLKVMHCNDSACSGGNESAVSPDTTGSVGQFTSLALDALGHPAVSYYDSTNGAVKVLRCNDSNCSGGGESVTTPDTGGTGNVGFTTSLALDSAGRPVVAYWDLTNSDLKVLRCNDANCAGGDDSITSPDTTGSTGLDPSLALDGAGNPVITYYDVTNQDIRLMHCNDANCAGGDESVTSPDTTGNVGFDPGIVLDGSGNPVLTYQDGTNLDLKIMHCNDVNCSGGNESIETPETAGVVGGFNAVALDGSGRPVVAYYDQPNGDVKVLRCDDANCAGSGETIIAVDTAGNVGSWAQVALDSSGRPVAAYYDTTNLDLKVLRCVSETCIVPGPELKISTLVTYRPPGACYNVLDSTRNPVFIVCDNTTTPASNPLCLPDGVCDDDDPSAGVISVPVGAGEYRVSPLSAPVNHASLSDEQACKASVKACDATLLYEPNNNPWFPWDVTGDGFVTASDFFTVLQRFGQGKP